MMVTVFEMGFMSVVSAWLVRNECATDPTCPCFKMCTRYTYKQTWSDDEINFMESKDLDNPADYSDSNLDFNVISQPLLSPPRTK